MRSVMAREFSDGKYNNRLQSADQYCTAVLSGVFAGADATGCVKSTCYNMTKAGYTVHVISDCVTSYDLKKLDEMYAYYANKGCEVRELKDYMEE